MSATVRAATLKDAERIYALVRRNADMLVPRSLGNIVESIDRLFVAEAEGETVGCAGYQIHPDLLVKAVMDRIAAFRPGEIVALTFTPEFFGSMGFAEIPKTKIMHKLYTGCINCTKHDNPYTCPETAMVYKGTMEEGK